MLFRPPEPNAPHHAFYQHIAAGGRVWRDDPKNQVREWLDLAKHDGDPSKILLYGYKDLSLPPSAMRTT